ncbi:TMEM165/GDT1 family protein [Haloarchaeobius iranensis]|uniref:Putative Ca2+/H+ antiporter, TMEM165/GDT1 family n=1 Tax=Haloarchaeobius iranensis TaxID=996166 RepID=A0A1G9T4K4_9EURY|nr:TMEM165/GDT1 family protein [Haloarchaeobius iranensis]SDM42572.1 Putative Ca2+/H+ antiporter, TMEM165/GDT1 family [Haloarchaeobius iranensis]
MTGFAEVVVVAFVAQLAVLPGEKVQFIIAGLSTRYHPLVVVSAAATAFAGWTALEILLGEFLLRVLPGVYLDIFTGTLFLVFAGLLLRSMPTDGDRSFDSVETDGGFLASVEGATETRTVFGRELPASLAAWFPIFGMMAAGEFGDKTQMVTIGLAAQYGATPAIWTGEMLAIVPVSLANAYFFHRFAGRVNLRTAHIASAALFGFFGLDTFLALLTGFSFWETFVGAATDAVFAVTDWLANVLPLAVDSVATLP